MHEDVLPPPVWHFENSPGNVFCESLLPINQGEGRHTVVEPLAFQPAFEEVHTMKQTMTVFVLMPIYNVAE